MELSILTSPVGEYLRLGVVYFHLIACCVAIGLVLTSDIAMVKQLLKGDTSVIMMTRIWKVFKKPYRLHL